MDSTRYCQHCGAALAPDVRFCGSCGQPVAAGSAGAPPAGGQPSVPPPPWEVPSTPPPGSTAPSFGPPSPSPFAGPTAPYGGAPGAPPAAGYASPRKKSHVGLWVIGGCLLVVVLIGVLAIGGVLWYKLQEDSPTAGGTSGGGVAVATTAVQEGIAKGELLYADDFSDPSSGWDIRQGESDAATYYQNGKYQIEIYDIDWVAWGNPGMSFTDFVVEVDATQVAGTDDNDFGVLLRYVDVDNFYRFEISGDGYYSFDLMEDDEWTTLIDWTDTPAIRQGTNTNRISVVCEGDLFTFYVNGQYLDEYRDGTFSEGDIGLLAGTIEEAPVHIAFDNVSVYALP